jgi:hypothetical protein
MSPWISNRREEKEMSAKGMYRVIINKGNLKEGKTFQIKGKLSVFKPYHHNT